MIEQAFAEPHRGRKQSCVDVSEGGEQAAGREGVEDGIEDFVLRGRHHVSPGKTADDAIGFLAVAQFEVAGEALGGILEDLHAREAAAEEPGIGLAEFDGEEVAAFVHPFEDEAGEGTGAGPEFDDEFALGKIATGDDAFRELRRAGPERADLERFFEEGAEESPASRRRQRHGVRARRRGVFGAVLGRAGLAEDSASVAHVLSRRLPGLLHGKAVSREKPANDRCGVSDAGDGCKAMVL